MWKLLIIFVMVDYQKIKRLFEVKFLDNADDFLLIIDFICIQAGEVTLIKLFI